MTAAKQNTKKHRFLSAKIDRIMLPLSIFFLIILFIINASGVSAAIRKALSLCVNSIIPSVFPCMVLSRLLISCGGAELIGRVFGKSLGKLFGISAPSVASFLLGAICGFPVGAVTAASLYKSNQISKDEFERLIGFTSLPSPAFVINAVGTSMLNNRNAGVFLFSLLILSSSIIGITVGKKKSSPSTSIIVKISDNAPISVNIVNAVTSSASAITMICAYSVFFDSLSTLFNELLTLLPVLSALVSGFFEFSGGCAAAASLGSRFALPITALILGWSGIGVHFQIMSVCGNISFKKYFLSVFLRGILCFTVSLAVNSLFFDI